MSPFYFGNAERRLFGIYEAARRSPARGAAVLCHPWGSEYIHSYRSMRQLANMMTAAGIHTLRFDYSGTGDSGGEMVDAGLRDWEVDIQTAMQELRDVTNAPQITLVGLRLGATLAAQVAKTPGVKVDALVMWDPVLCGKEYVDELHLACRTGWGPRQRPVSRRAENGGGHEILGFPLPRRMEEEFRNLNLLASASAFPARSLIVASQSLASHRNLQQIRGCMVDAPIAVERMDAQPAWIEWPLGHPKMGTVPVKILQRIVEWLA